MTTWTDITENPSTWPKDGDRCVLAINKGNEWTTETFVRKGWEVLVLKDAYLRLGWKCAWSKITLPGGE